MVWLALIDDGRYGEGWDHAAQYLKSAVDRRQLVAALSAVRKPLGRVISRKLRSKKYMTSLPGVPDGDYVVIHYATSFEKKRSAVETITPVLEPDGTMKVSGYYIR